MAARKTTKKTTNTEEESETKATTTKSKTTRAKSSSRAKSSKNIKLTFAPIMSAAQKFRILLRKKELKKINGRDVPTYVPLIEGLPMKLEVARGEVIEVTPEQLEQLQEGRWVETDEEYKERQKFIESMDSQHPETLTWDMIIAEGGNWATLSDSQKIVYNDKLLRV